MKGWLMLKNEKPLQGGRPIRGNDTLNITDKAFDGKIPLAAVNALEHEAAGLMHGTATLTLHVKDGHLLRYTTNRERSFISGKLTTGGTYE